MPSHSHVEDLYDQYHHVMLLSVYVEEAHVVIEQNNSHNENMQNRSVRKTSRPFTLVYSSMSCELQSII